MVSGIKQLVGYSEGTQTLVGNRILLSGTRKLYPLAFNLPNYFAPLTTQASLYYELTLEGDALHAKVKQFDRQTPVLDRASECLLKKVR